MIVGWVRDEFGGFGSLCRRQGGLIPGVRLIISWIVCRAWSLGEGGGAFGPPSRFALFFKRAFKRYYKTEGGGPNGLRGG
jgi:hypothetical protein